MRIKLTRRFKRERRIRNKIRGVGVKPRLSVFRSNKHILLQLIDDKEGKTLVFVRDQEVGTKTKKEKKTNIEKAYLVGELAANKAKDLGIDKVVFDRGRYKYHGIVKAVAEGARRGGLKF